LAKLLFFFLENKHELISAITNYLSLSWCKIPVLPHQEPDSCWKSSKYGFVRHKVSELFQNKKY